MSSSIDDLEKLESLRKSGAIDAVEFESLKESILSKSTVNEYAIQEPVLNGKYSNHATHLNHKRLALAGSAILFIGIFCPLISLPILGSVNYFQNGEGDGVILLILSVITAGAAATDKVTWALFTGLGAFVVMVISFFMFQQHIDEMQTKIQSELAGNPFQELSDAALNSIQLQWGCAVLMLGAATMVYAGWSARTALK